VPPPPPAPERIAPGRHVELPGRGTTFVREMEGPPGAPALLLLHGLGATGGTNFASAFAPLAEHFRVVAVDHRGHGRGMRTQERFSLAACADDAAALADVLDIDRFVPVGYSMGGTIAQLMWHRHRDRVDGLVLCATSRDFRGYWHERLRFAGLGLLVAGLRVAPRRAVRELAEQVSDDFVTPGNRRWALREVRRHDPRSVLEAAEAVGRFSSRAWIDDVDVPAAVLVTAEDRLVPVHRQAKLALSIPSAVVHVVEGSHLACAASPDAFACTLLEACLQVDHRASRWSAAA
jgi:3-oxoadipate enol-lactonase